MGTPRQRTLAKNLFRSVKPLTPVLLSGGGRTGSTAIMSMLGTDPRVAFDREYPFESRYLLYFVKYAMFSQRPDLFQFLVAEEVFDFDRIGFGGPGPGTDYVRVANADNLPHLTLEEWVTKLWSLFCQPVIASNPQLEFYAEKAPGWLAPIVREFMPCYTIYNLRDPRDIFISANAFMKKKNFLGFARAVQDSDVDHARHIALAFVNTFENYFADRHRPDVMLLRYEDLVLEPQRVSGDIRKLCGINCYVEKDSKFFSMHRTAKSLENSVTRWKSEAVPQEVILFFERSLRQEMIELGYPISHPEASGCKNLSFAEGEMLFSALTRSSHGFLEQKEDHAVVNVTGIDFSIVLPLEAFEAASMKEVWVSVKGSIGDSFSLYWQYPGEDFAEERCMSLRYSPSPHWTVLSFPVYTHPKWKGTIAKLRLDLFNALNPPHQGRGQIRYVRLVG